MAYEIVDIEAELSYNKSFVAVDLLDEKCDCVWCGKKAMPWGFNLYYFNFTICKDCVNLALSYESKPRWAEHTCDYCRKTAMTFEGKFANNPWYICRKDLLDAKKFYDFRAPDSRHYHVMSQWHAYLKLKR